VTSSSKAEGVSASCYSRILLHSITVLLVLCKDSVGEHWIRPRVSIVVRWVEEILFFMWSVLDNKYQSSVWCYSSTGRFQLNT